MTSTQTSNTTLQNQTELAGAGYVTDKKDASAILSAPASVNLFIAGTCLAAAIKSVLL